MRESIPLLLALCGALLLSRAAEAQQQPQAFCGRAGTDDTLRPIPLSLVPEARSLFSRDMPPDMAQRTTFFRCMRSRTLMCNTGANLPCGKADTGRDNPGASAWCKVNPQSDFIPMYAVGHDTIFAWRCRNGRPEITSQNNQVDERGFITRYWKPVN